MTEPSLHSDRVDSNRANAQRAAAPPLLYGLDERPPWPQLGLAAIAHLLAIVASIATAPLLIARGLNLDAAATGYLISSALIVSGIATAVQILRVGPFGSGLLSIQGTSFAFIGALLLAGSIVDRSAMTDSDFVGLLLGSAAVGALCTVVIGYYVERLSRVITPNVTGISVFLLGLSLVGAAWNNFQFTLATTARTGPVYIEAAVVFVVIIGSAWLASRLASGWLRLTSITLGLLAGMLAAWLLDDLTPPAAGAAQGLSWLRPLAFPLGFDVVVFALLTPIYFVTMAEAIGDLTATAMLSRQPTTGAPYWRRVRGGVMADGLNSVVAAGFGTFPNTTFSQNNGVIRLTGVASRAVGIVVAALLIVLGTLPGFANLFQWVPGGVLHATTGLLFAMIAITGLRLLEAQPNRRRTLTMLIVCTLAAFALTLVPPLLADVGVTLPAWLTLLFGFPVASGALIALLWEWLSS
ncbi:MAG: solute carrier family 23 protein [Pseudomonadota bacterium]